MTMARRGLDIETIIATAANIADHEGIEAVTMAALSEKLGVRSPSLYNHINGLDGIRRLLALRGLKELGNTLSRAAAANADIKTEEPMLELAKAYILFARKHPGLYELTLHAPDEEEGEYADAGNRIIELLMNVLKPYELEQDEIIHSIRGFRSMLHGFSALERKGGFGMPLEVEESLSFAIKAFLNGLQRQR